MELEELRQRIREWKQRTNQGAPPADMAPPDDAMIEAAPPVDEGYDVTAEEGYAPAEEVYAQPVADEGYVESVAEEGYAQPTADEGYAQPRHDVPDAETWLSRVPGPGPDQRAASPEGSRPMLRLFLSS